VADAFARALVEEATKKAGLVWLTVPGQPAQAVWHIWHEGAVYLVGGGIEQPLPDLASAAEVMVTVPSKDKGGRLITWLAEPNLLEPGTPGWDAAAAALHAKRLNPPDGEHQPQRWAEQSQIWRLEPTDTVTEQPGEMPNGSGAAPPVPTKATTRGRLPFVIGRRARRR
jgi:hypothetical protein